MANANFTPDIGPYTTLKPFRFWCQKVLPLVYDDSLSYYELLGKVVDYLNKTMEDVDTVTTDMQGLLSAYEALQGWVNHYYDSADFEAAIDAGLDRMVEDGSMDTIITPVITNQLPSLVNRLLPDEVEEQLPGVVASQIGLQVEDQLPNVVSNQIGGTVQTQLPGVVSNQIGPVVEDKIVDPVEDWLDANVSGGIAVDRTLSILGAGADAAFTGARLETLDDTLGYEHVADTGFIITTTEPYAFNYEVINDNSAFSDHASHTYKMIVIPVTTGDKYCINAHKISIANITEDHFAVTYAFCAKHIGDPQTDIPYYLPTTYSTDDAENVIATVPEINIPTGQYYDETTGYLVVITANIEDPVYKVVNEGIRKDIADLKSDLTQIGKYILAPKMYDISDYSSGAIANGIAFIADSVIPANSFIKNVKLYSGVSANASANIVLIRQSDNQCIFAKSFIVEPGWNTIEINQFVNVAVRLGSYNSQPIYTTSATGEYIFSSSGLGRYLPADAKVGETVTPSKIYSGNFGLAIQWNIVTGYFGNTDHRLTGLEKQVAPYDDIIYDLETPVMTSGYYVSASTGQLVQAAWGSYSDYYHVGTITDFFSEIGSGVGCCYYTFDKQFISGFDDGVEGQAKWHRVIPPENASYIRFSNRSGSFPDYNVRTVNRIDHRLEYDIDSLYKPTLSPKLFDDVSSYSGGSILGGISVVADAVIPSGTVIETVKIYSDVSSATNAKINIISNSTKTCLKIVEFSCMPGWNVVNVNDSFSEDVRIGIFNAQPKYITGSAQEYLFSSNGLGRFLPADITVGQVVSFSKLYSGNFALAVQWTVSSGKLPKTQSLLEAQIKETKQELVDILPMYDSFICIGDSLTYSQVFIATGTTPETNRQAFKTYPQILASLCGGVSYNYATPGDTGVSWWTRSSDGAFDHHGLYIVFLGTNDGFTDTIDTDCPGSNPDNFDKTTNTGAYGAILQTIKNNGDKAVLITPWGGGGSSLATTKEVIEKFSTKYDFPIIDVDTPGRSAEAYHLYPDGTGQNLLHFNDLGYAWLANEVRKKINLLSYSDKFKIMRTQ